MHIELLGLSGVKIQSNDITILLTPPTAASGLKTGRHKTDIVVLGASKDDPNATPANEKIFTIDSAGEYESGGAFFYCLATPPTGDRASLLTLMTLEGVRLGHLSALGRPLNENEKELFEGCDVLLVPVGGNDVLDAKQARAVVAELEPRVVIPIHFFHKDLKNKYEKPDIFLSEMNAKTESQAKVKITKKDLPQDTLEVIHLEV